MSKEPIKIYPKSSELQADRKTGEIAPIREEDSGPYIRFRYSYQSMSVADGKTHIQAKKARFENGKYETEEFEGTTDGEHYTRAFSEMQQVFTRQMENFFKPFYSLPFFDPLKDEDEE
jgi:hypothetical protein